MSKMDRRLFRELMQDEDFRELVGADEVETDDVAVTADWREGVRPTWDSFYRALKANPPPCDGCPFAARCRDEHLACVEFAQWTDRDFLRPGAPGYAERKKRAEDSTPDAPYVWVYDLLFPAITPEAWHSESEQLDAAIANGTMQRGRPPLFSSLATATVTKP